MKLFSFNIRQKTKVISFLQFKLCHYNHHANHHDHHYRHHAPLGGNDAVEEYLLTFVTNGPIPAALQKIHINL